jgi:hypothetical protein
MTRPRWGIAVVLAVLYGLGFLRAWELLGFKQIGLRRILNPLQQVTPPASEAEGRGEEEGRGDDHSAGGVRRPS